MNTPNHRFIRIEPYGISSCGPLSVLDFNLPNSGYIDLSTLLMFYNLTHSNTAAGSGCALTKDAESIINDLEVYVNGTPLNIIKNYNQVFNVISKYGMTAEEVAERGSHRSTLLNGNPSTGNAASFNETYCAKKWLGFLGCGEVIDLSKNSIHIRITTAERFVITGPNAGDTYTMSQIYMNALYYEQYNEPLTKSMEYDDYKTIYTYLNSVRAVETSLKFISNHKVDYAVATFYNNATHRIISNALSDGQSPHFRKTGYSDFWNFKVNGKFIYSYDVPVRESQMTLHHVFKDTFKNVAAMYSPLSGPGGVIGTGNNFNFHAGCPIYMKLDTSEEVEVSFVSRTVGVFNNVPHFMFVKLTKAMTVN